MNIVVKQLLVSFTLAGIIPAIMISTISNAYGKPGINTTVENSTSQSREITVIDHTGESQSMELETYITHVLLGEVSEDFHMEALKAQAVAARTYTLYCVEILRKHHIGAVCMSPQCCQAYIENADYLSCRGTEQGIRKVQEAVRSTEGEVLRYDSDLICAAYFASSGGITEDALEVWGKSYPYLQPKESPGEENCGYFSSKTILSPEELQKVLGVQLSGTPASWFGMVKYTNGGGIDLIRIGGRLYTGKELRKLFNLRSTMITFTATDDAIVIDTKGYGHRIGMSQHGADAMANHGSDYKQILKHYYTDTTLGHIRE